MEANVVNAKGGGSFGRANWMNRAMDMGVMVIMYITGYLRSDPSMKELFL